MNDKQRKAMFAKMNQGMAFYHNGKKEITHDPNVIDKLLDNNRLGQSYYDNNTPRENYMIASGDAVGYKLYVHIFGNDKVTQHQRELAYNALQTLASKEHSNAKNAQFFLRKLREIKS